MTKGRPTFDEQLGAFYRKWSELLELALDEEQPRADRLTAMQWIDQQIGEEQTTDETLDEICAALRRDL